MPDIDNVQATLIGLASGVEGWTTVQGAMSLAVVSLAQKGLVETQNENAPISIEYRLTEAGTAITSQSH